ncbi:TetR/AcrR family transcriptional regulator [Curtobacterium sp. MCBD17_034]|uniref:TetR/AcrR family transcriptional regulator n=2 Tax=Curtobacterium TaxID=2034 RepID=UPI000DAA3CDC|nr:MULTISPECIES: helix-turn-helix domain-containing protein [unclassified Curtobacterium]PZF56058.1 TetR/AcrR family transcriptional regulator [Curtobacterium sp. MCBD17_034]PZM32926.1 TetR/AcrR family transcriptional regulator [Curtobacterium sp. MCBD17_031]
MSASEDRPPRRANALSRDQVVLAAVQLLDDGGTPALTVRALSESLATGRGAIYHYVSSIDEVVGTAADHVLGPVVTAEDPDAASAIRSITLGVFRTIAARPWVGTQLARNPSQPAVLRMWKAIGHHLLRLGVPESRLSDAGSALVNYVLGAAAQYAAGPGQAEDMTARQRYLDELAARWADEDDDALVQDIAARLGDHDDQEQFLAGVDIFLAGVRALTNPHTDQG